MSPKKQVAKPKAKAATAAPLVLAGASMTAGVAENLNSDYYQHVSDAIDSILQHPEFSDIQTCDPVGICINALMQMPRLRMQATRQDVTG